MVPGSGQVGGINECRGTKLNRSSLWVKDRPLPECTFTRLSSLRDLQQSEAGRGRWERGGRRGKGRDGESEGETGKEWEKGRKGGSKGERRGRVIQFLQF